MAKISEDVAHSGNEANHEPFQTNPISSKAMIECSASPNAFSTAGECGRKRKLDNIIFENLPDIHESGKDLQKKDITTLSACSSTDEVQNSMPLQQVEMLLPNKPDKSFEGNNTSLSTSLPPSSVFPTGEKDSSGANDIREQSCIQPSRQGAIQEGSLNCPVCCESAYGLMVRFIISCRHNFSKILCEKWFEYVCRKCAKEDAQRNFTLHARKVWLNAWVVGEICQQGLRYLYARPAAVAKVKAVTIRTKMKAEQDQITKKQSVHPFAEPLLHWE